MAEVAAGSVSAQEQLEIPLVASVPRIGLHRSCPCGSRSHHEWQVVLSDLQNRCTACYRCVPPWP